uniref:Phospholipase-like protein n=1 Tax=Tanacetum cinerariifolium TaxID=118510 RepID=A0A6L2K6J3_TANCI|nr:phospholipase-like protein [Tanacetum cinerariifolium]
MLLLEGDGFLDSKGGAKNPESNKDKQPTLAGVLDEVRALRKEVALVKFDDARIAKLERLLNDNFMFRNDIPNDLHLTCSRPHIDNANVVGHVIGIHKADKKNDSPNGNQNDVNKGLTCSANDLMSTCSGPDILDGEVVDALIGIHKADVKNDRPNDEVSFWTLFRETDEITDLNQILEEVLLTERGDGVAGIKQRRRDPSSDDIRDLVMTSGHENPICTLGDYSKPSHEGYRNTIELPLGNNVYCMEDLEQAFVEYASLRKYDMGNRKFTTNQGPRNFNEATNTWKEKPNFNWEQTQTFTSPRNGLISTYSSNYQMKLEKPLDDFDSHQEKRLSGLRTQLGQQQDDMIRKIILLRKTIFEKLNDAPIPEPEGNFTASKNITSITISIEMSSEERESKAHQSYSPQRSFTYECDFMILEDTTSITDRHLGEMAFGRPFIDEIGLIYNREEGTVMFKQDDKKITFKMPHTMKIFKKTRLMGLSTDSIPRPPIKKTLAMEGRTTIKAYSLEISTYKTEEITCSCFHGCIDKDLINLVILDVRSPGMDNGEVVVAGMGIHKADGQNDNPNAIHNAVNQGICGSANHPMLDVLIQVVCDGKGIDKAYRNNDYTYSQSKLNDHPTTDIGVKPIPVDEFTDDFMDVLNDEKSIPNYSLDDMKLQDEEDKLISTPAPVNHQQVDDLIDVHKDKTTVLQENVKDQSNKSQYANVVIDDYKPFLASVFANVKANRKKCGIERNYVLREPDAKWAMESPHFLPCTLGGSMINNYSNDVRYPVAWRDVEKVYFNEPKKNWCLAELHISTGVVSFYVLLVRLSCNLPLTVDDPLQTALAYRERMLQYFWSHKFEAKKP